MNLTAKIIAAHQRHGAAIVYTPPVGDPVTWRGFPGTHTLTYGDAPLPLDGLCLDIIRPAASPAAGGVIRYEGADYHLSVLPIPYPAAADPLGVRARLLCDWGIAATVRLATGDGATRNPPVGGDWTLATAAAAGATTLSLVCPYGSGQLLAGDRLTIAGASYSLAAAATVAGGRADVVLTAAVSAPIATGTGVAPDYACDIPARVAVTGWSDQITAGLDLADRRLILPAVCIGNAILSGGQTIVVAGHEYRIITAAAAYQSGAPIIWDLRVR